MKDNIYNMENWKKENTIDFESLKGAYMEPEMPAAQVERLKAVMDRAKADNRKVYRRSILKKIAATAAAVLAAFVILPNTSVNVAYAMEQLPLVGGLVKVVTFREYIYEDTQHKAEMIVPELAVGEEGIVSIGEDIPSRSDVNQVELEKSTEEINEEIKTMTDELIHQFKEHLDEEMGYLEMQVSSQVLVTTPEYFTLKVLCYQGAGSGYQWNYYYTIDLRTGKQLELKDIFQEGADYITLISENIKAQMLAQMEEDVKIYYWLEDEIEDLNFKGITEETSFYLNAAGNVVIAFDEGEVAPMYMGAVEFEIPGEVLEDIWR